MKDTNQSSGDNSNTINSGRDTTVTVHNPAMSTEELKYMVMGVLWESFPRLRDEALETARKEVKSFTEDLFSEMIDRKIESIEEKLKSPDIQTAINEGLHYVAKKTNKSDKETLKQLLINKLNTNDEDEDFEIDDAITTIAKLSRRHIKFLAIIHYLKGLHKIYHIPTESGTISVRIDPAAPDNLPKVADDSYLISNCRLPVKVVLDDYTNHYGERFKSIFDSEDDVEVNRSYLVSKGCLTMPIISGGDFNKFFESRTGIKTNDQENVVIKELKKELKKYGVNNLDELSSINLTTTGIKIALSFLSSRFHISGF